MKMRSIRLVVLALALACAISVSNAQTATPSAPRSIGVPQLINRLDSRDPEVRFAAIRALGEWDADAESAVPALVRCLRDKSEDVRFEAAWALGHIHSNPELSVPALLDAMDDRAKDVRMQATASLTVFPSWGKRIVPKLMAGLKSKDENTRFNCAQALGEFGEFSKHALPLLLKAMDDANEGVQTAAVISLTQLKPRSKEVARRFITLMESGKGVLSGVAARGLGDIGVDELSTLPALRRVMDTRLTSKHADVVLFAAISYTKLVSSLPMEQLNGTYGPGLDIAEIILKDRLHYLGDPKEHIEPALDRIRLVRERLKK